MRAAQGHFLQGARKQRTDDCMDAGGRAIHGAIAENRSVQSVHEDLSTQLSQKKTIFEVPIILLL